MAHGLDDAHRHSRSCLVDPLNDHGRMLDGARECDATTPIEK